MTRILSGSYIYSLDRKGRVVIPATFAPALGSPFMLCAAPEGRALVLPRALWLTLLETDGGRMWREYWLGASWEVWRETGSGRVSLPHLLRQHMGLRVSADVAVVGLGEAVLIETAAAWRERASEVLRGSRRGGKGLLRVRELVEATL